MQFLYDYYERFVDQGRGIGLYISNRKAINSKYKSMALSDEPQCLLLHFNMSGFLSFTHVYATLLGKHSLKKEKILTSLLLFFKYFGLKLCV